MIHMAKPIVRTPPLSVEDAKRFIELDSHQTISEKDENFLRACVEIHRKYKK